MSQFPLAKIIDFATLTKESPVDAASFLGMALATSDGATVIVKLPAAFMDRLQKAIVDLVTGKISTRALLADGVGDEDASGLSDGEIAGIHYHAVGSNVPSVAAQGDSSAIGSGGGVAIFGKDSAGVITITTGTSITGGGRVGTFSFGNSWGTETPVILLTEQTEDGEGDTYSAGFRVYPNAGGMIVYSKGSLPESKVILLGFHVISY